MNFKDVPTLSQEQDIADYRALAEQVPNGSVIVEVGVHKGGSILGLADIIKRKNLKPVLVDLWDALILHWPDTPDFRAFSQFSMVECAKNLQGMGLKALMICGTSQDAAPWMILYAPALVYIDADHGYQAVKSDIEEWWPLIPSGGILAGHDYGNENEGVKRAVDEKFGDKVNVNKQTHSWVWWVRKP